MAVASRGGFSLTFAHADASAAASKRIPVSFGRVHALVTIRLLVRDAGESS
jgi:hypothetical protein